MNVAALSDSSTPSNCGKAAPTRAIGRCSRRQTCWTHYGAELPDLVDVGAQQFVKGDDQAGASVGKSVAERGQHPTEVFGGPGPGPL